MKSPTVKETFGTAKYDMKGWKEGPLPPNTYNWGGVTEKGEHPHDGFNFADFCGDHVKISGVEGSFNTVIKADEVGWYNNCLELPGW